MRAIVQERESAKSYAVTVRVTRSGPAERASAEIRARLERDLPLMFPEAKVTRISRAAR